MVEELDFCLLGPLRVRSGGRDVPIGPGGQRALLAALLLSAGRMVPAAELIEVLWGAAPPPAVRSSLQNHVMRLRRGLTVTGRALVVTQPGGYLIDIEPAKLDVRRFETALARAKAAAQAASWVQAAELLRAGLELWRGQPLSGVDSEALERREVPRLTELRLQALETQILADLCLGRPAETVSLARQLAVTYPLRERLHALLMIALYLDGQQAGALTAYQNVRDGLVVELGIEPGAELRRIHQQILQAVPPAEVLAGAGGAPAVPPRATPGSASAPAMRSVPRQLPSLAGNFTGRDAELATLTALAGEITAQRDTSPVVVIAGTAGAGKTALAVHWARRVADRFPDGQLYLDLRGYGPGGPGGQLSPAVALASLLRTLGLPDRDIPADTEERAARYRSMLAGRRMLILLDNAGAADHARLLLPADGGCLTLVTSRDTLAGLMARDGARRLELGPLPLPDAIALLRELTVGRVAAATPARIAELAERCARLPLALRVAAELVAARPAASLAGLTAELADQGQRLDLPDAGGDPRTALRAVFSWSYQHLDAGAARDFRLLGLHPGADFDVHAAAAVADRPARLAVGSLTRLVRASLVQVDRRTRRYGMHDLLRAYAAEQVIAADGPAGRQAALSRLLDHYAGAASAAMDALYPAERRQRPRDITAGAGAPVFAPAAARSWLSTERHNLTGAIRFAATEGWPVRAVQLADTISRYLDAGGYYLAAIEVHGHAVAAARQAGDLAAEATALMNLGMAEVRQGRSARAASHLRRAVELDRRAGDVAGEARAIGDLGCLYQQLGHYDLARNCVWRALALFRQSGDRTGEARALVNLGDICRRRGRHDQAVRYLCGSATLAGAIGDDESRAYALAYLGDVLRRQGRYQAAARSLRQALRLCRRTGSRPAEGYTLTCLGDVYARTGDVARARRLWQRARAVLEAVGADPVQVPARLGSDRTTTPSSRSPGM